MTRYLNEIRLGKEKAFVKNIIQDVRKESDLSSYKRPVPHITLFGPYNTRQGSEAKRRTQQVLSNYRVVPVRVCGFDSKIIMWCTRTLSLQKSYSSCDASLRLLSSRLSMITDLGTLMMYMNFTLQLLPTWTNN